MKQPLIPLKEIEKKLNIQFKDPHLLTLAFVHRSYWNERQDQVLGHNERLEFFGDSVLGLILAEYLYNHLPDTSEGILSDLRARLVESASCVKYLLKLGVEEYVLLGKGEKLNRGKGRDTILADLFEAVIGAIYLDSGYMSAKKFFFTHFLEEVEEIVAAPSRNWKAELQDYAQKKFQVQPIYEVVEETGPAHEKHFKIKVWINQEQVGVGEGSSKKHAQQMAAENAITKLKV